MSETELDICLFTFGIEARALRTRALDFMNKNELLPDFDASNVAFLNSSLKNDGPLSMKLFGNSCFSLN